MPEITTTKPTRQDFLAAYRDELTQGDEVGWTRQPGLLDAFMGKVERALAPDAFRAGWGPYSVFTSRAWRRIGMVGTPTLAKLRALPVEAGRLPTLPGIGDQDRPMRVPGGAA